MSERRREEKPNDIVKTFVEVCSVPMGLILSEATQQTGEPLVAALCGLGWEGAIAFGPGAVAAHTERAYTAMNLSQRAWQFLASPIKKMLPSNLNDASLFPVDGECIRYSIPRGFSTQERIDAMTTLMSSYVREDMVHPAVRGLAVSLIQAFHVDGRETLLIGALFQRYVQTEMTYVKDPLYRELLTAPHKLVVKKAEDCDGLTTMLVTMLASVGISGAIVLVSTRKDKIPNHVCPAVFLEDSRLIPLEATLPKAPGWLPPNATYIKIVPVRYIA